MNQDITKLFKSPALDLVADMPEAAKSCDSCLHQNEDERTGILVCRRTGWHCETEMKHGGLCRGKAGELRLWHPRPPKPVSWWRRAFPRR